MRWFRRAGAKPTTKTATEALPTEPTEHISLVLNVVYHQLHPERKYHILDLGSAFGSNVDFFSQFRCKIHIEDLYQTLSSFDFLSPEDGFSYDVVYDYLLPYGRNTSFDLIFVWDLFNYMEEDEFRHLVLYLGKFCRKGTLLFSLISTLKHIPESPTRFKILDQEHLQYEVSSPVLKPCPRYQQTDLTRLMPHFRVCNSFLLRNGFKEYLFSYEN